MITRLFCKKYNCLQERSRIKKLMSTKRSLIKMSVTTVNCQKYFKDAAKTISSLYKEISKSLLYMYTLCDVLPCKPSLGRLIEISPLS